MEPRDVRGIQIAAGAAAAGFVAAYCIGALGGLESKHVEPEPEPVEAPLASHPDGRRRVPTGHEKDQAEWTLQLWEAAEETASTEEREVAKQGILKGDSAAVHAFERSVFKRVSRLAKGSSHDEHPLMLQTHVWLEAEDGKHRYGSLLFKFYRHWAKEDTKQSFFYWLDFGGGKDLQSVTSDKGEVITRTELEESCVQYCTAEQRKKFVVKIEDGLLRWPNQSNKLCHTESLDGPDAFKSPKSGLLMMIVSSCHSSSSVLPSLFDKIGPRSIVPRWLISDRATLAALL
eukprot:SAG31_NODE_72_length_27821_cov_26.870572_4_plen_288_part_00